MTQTFKGGTVYIVRKHYPSTPVCRNLRPCPLPDPADHGAGFPARTGCEGCQRRFERWADVLGPEASGRYWWIDKDIIENDVTDLLSSDWVELPGARVVEFRK